MKKIQPYTMDDFVRDVREKAKQRRWGNWLWDKEEGYLCLMDGDCEEYSINLKSCGSAESLLDWIAQVSKKTWVTREAVGYLVQALDDILCIQGEYVWGSKGWGRFKQKKSRVGKKED